MNVVRIKPAEKDGLGTTRNHAYGLPGAGGDYTLCGFTLDGDPECVESTQEIEGSITCEQCWQIIEFCRTVKQRKLAPDRASSHKQGGK